MRVTWLVAASSNPMGMEYYEHAIQGAIRSIAADDDDYRLLQVAGWHSRQPGTVRLPTKVTRHPTAAVLAGAVLGRGTLVHRFDLRLPPTPREVVTVHDLPPRRFPDEGDLPTHAVRARRSRAVIVPSSFAAEEVRELLGVQSVDVVPYGVDPAFSPHASDAGLRRSLGLDRLFVVHAAGATQRKNLAGLAGAWAALGNRDVQLVLCGPPDDRRTRLFEGLPGVILAGKQPRAAVAALMAMSAAVVVPSIYEGFGLPALEGMASGVPVVAAAAGALPEVVGDGALLVEPSAEGLADGLQRVLSDTGLITSLTERGVARASTFTWERAARDHVMIYRRSQ